MSVEGDLSDGVLFEMRQTTTERHLHASSERGAPSSALALTMGIFGVRGCVAVNFLTFDHMCKA